MPRFLATSTVLITFGTIASPPLTSIGAPATIKSFWNLCQKKKQIFKKWLLLCWIRRKLENYLHVYDNNSCFAPFITIFWGHLLITNFQFFLQESSSSFLVGLEFQLIEFLTIFIGPAAKTLNFSMVGFWFNWNWIFNLHTSPTNKKIMEKFEGVVYLYFNKPPLNSCIFFNFFFLLNWDVLVKEINL